MDMCMEINPMQQYSVLLKNGKKKSIDCFFSNQMIASYEIALKKDNNLSK